MVAEKAIIQEVEISLRIKAELSQEERDRATKSLAESVETNALLLRERKAMSTDYNERIQQNQGVMSAEAKIVKFGFEMIETACVMEYDRVAQLVRIRHAYEEEGDDPIWIEEAWRPATPKEQALANAMAQAELPGTGDDPEAVTDGLETSGEE